MKFFFIWIILKKWNLILKRERYSCNKAATTCLVYKGETKKKDAKTSISCVILHKAAEAWKIRMVTDVKKKIAF